MTIIHDFAQSLTSDGLSVLRGARIYYNYLMWYVYVLVSDKEENWHYYGYSTDLRRRIAEHSTGKVRSTKPYVPLHLKYYEAYDNEAAAKHREQVLKRSRSAVKALHGRIYGAIP